MKRFAFPIVLLVLLISLQAAKYGARYAGIQSRVTAAVIVEETSQRPKLSKETIAVLMAASAKGVKVVDIDVRGPGKKDPPAVLVPFLSVAEREKLPQLILECGTKYEAKPLPASIKELEEALR